MKATIIFTFIGITLCILSAYSNCSILWFFIGIFYGIIWFTSALGQAYSIDKDQIIKKLDNIANTFK